MRKIGIVSLYYNNYNYGGLLQAFALVKTMQKMGCSAEQISYVNYSKEKISVFDKIRRKTFARWVVIFFEKIRHKFVAKLDKRELAKYEKELILKKERFDEFMNSIPHSQVYDNDTIKMISEEYDIFITGSDQVWNPNWWSEAYFLMFTNKKKIAYACSFGVNDIPKDKREFFEKAIKDFDYVTVREKRGKELVESYSNQIADVVVDPTLLLDVNEWEEIEEQYAIAEKYILCYLLGKERKIQKMVERIARRMDLSIVYIAYSQPNECYKEKGFGDIILRDVGPRQFLYLVHHAQCVLTDSFHAVVFSLIYHRSFWVMDRYVFRKKQDNARIISLLNLVGLQKRYIQKSNEVSENDIINWSAVDKKITDKQFESLVGCKEHIMFE